MLNKFILTLISKHARVIILHIHCRGYMKKIPLELLQIFLIWLLCTVPSSAESLSSTIFRDKENIVHFGAPVSFEAYSKLLKMYKIKPFSEIRLTSNGGEYDAGMKIAHLVYTNDISVFVPKYCASACTFIFFGARVEHRDIAPTAMLGLHNVSFGMNNSTGEDANNSSITVKEALDFAQEAVVRSGMMISFYSANGIPSDVLLQVSQTYGQGIINVQRADLVRWGAIQAK